MVWRDMAFVALFAASLLVAPSISRWCRLPLITVHLIAGLLAQSLLAVRMPRALAPSHEAALACITFAAGSELVVAQLRLNFGAICWVSLMLTLSSLVFVSLTTLPLLRAVGGSAGAHGGLELQLVIAGLAAVVSIGRSPSSAIAVVSEQRADGPFTQQVLSVTMCTDVIVIVLFTAAAEMSLGFLSEHDSLSATTMTLRFSGHTLLQLGLSTVHGGCLTLLCLGVLRLPLRPIRGVALLLVGGYAFVAESMLEHLVIAKGWPSAVRLEPMLSCIIAGFLICNGFGARTEFDALLHTVMSPLLAFFFFSTGTNMRVATLKYTWPVAVALFIVRLVSLWVGNLVGCWIAGSGSAHRRYGWLAYVTQAGISLGLTDEIAEMFPGWGPALQATLISVIVLNQLVGPPLFEYALRATCESGRRPVDTEMDSSLDADGDERAEDEPVDETNRLSRWA
ncbi:hypothetical protein AB1Y20_019722 [Prymnesium parvum]|uniref:Cation/H+ exchanger domain-containing protein n=1 Tax=Prymnesium parvum TaxID=97485 RepID=A0AB34JUU8_PRYPA